MTLDTTSLRVAFAVLAFTLCVLFYFAAFRGTRSSYSGWWCVALTLFLVGSAAFLLNGTPHQAWANPAGNFLLVAGAAAVWAGARSLRKERPRLLSLITAPVITAVASILDSPATNIWAGGPFFLASMGVTIGLAASELWQLQPGDSKVRTLMAASASCVSAYYLVRALVFVLEGPDGPVFVAYFNSAITTLVTMALLAVVSFSMSALSIEQQTRDLKSLATRDGLTGLLNRSAFQDKAATELKRMINHGVPGALILADLDNFKAVNDTYGHATGDTALKLFAAACTDSVRSMDLVGRYGGEEFILLLPGADASRAEIVAKEISSRIESASLGDRVGMPTASYGIMSIGPDRVALGDLIESADAALYKAKTDGRNRAVVGTLSQRNSR